jgi:hypothetical protein
MTKKVFPEQDILECNKIAEALPCGRGVEEAQKEWANILVPRIFLHWSMREMVDGISFCIVRVHRNESDPDKIDDEKSYESNFHANLLNLNVW